MQHRFFTKIRQGSAGKVAGIVVPPEIVDSIGKGRRPPVKVTVNGYTYRSTVGTMNGKFMIPLSRENLRAAGLTGDEELEIRIRLDIEPRDTPPPSDLRSALVKARLLGAFEKAAPSRRKEFVRLVEDAKTPETRQRRIVRVLDALS